MVRRISSLILLAAVVVCLVEFCAAEDPLPPGNTHRVCTGGRQFSSVSPRNPLSIGLSGSPGTAPRSPIAGLGTTWITSQDGAAYALRDGKLVTHRFGPEVREEVGRFSGRYPPTLSLDR